MLYNQDWERKSNPTSDLLNKAASLLEKHGHVKCELERDGAMCLAGALNMANHGSPKYRNLEDISGAIDALHLAINIPAALTNILMRIEKYSKIAQAVGWNNAPERTAQEVIDALRLAAKVVEKQHAI